MKRPTSWADNAVRLIVAGLVLSVACQAATPRKQPTKTPSKTDTTRISRDPYLGAILVNAADGQSLFEDNADARGYPASVLKLMDLLIILERIEAGTLKLDERVTVTREAAKVGGSQVWLAEKEEFSLDDLLYALMVQSANDAAVALAIHVAGTKEAFVELMNRRAQELGLTSTQFHSVHGLPPEKGQEPDATTARDLAKLAVELLKHKDCLRYTATKEREFRPGLKKVIMRSHNHLLGAVPGCDGLKTGYYGVAGFSIVATAEREGRRVVAVVLGSRARETRDAKASQILAKGLAALPAVPPPVVKPEPPPPPPPPPPPEKHWGSRALIIGLSVALLFALVALIRRR